MALPSSTNSDHASSSSSPVKWWTEDTIAVVTGANRGIGFSLAKRLQELGLTVVLTARDTIKGQAAAHYLRCSHQLKSVHFHQLDVADNPSIQAFSSWLRLRFGGLDVLVNNAGVSFNDVDTNSVSHAETVVRTNFYGTKMLIEALFPLFRRCSNKSRILNLSSQLGLPNKMRNQSLKAMIEDQEGGLTVEAIELMVVRFLYHVRLDTWEKEGWPEVWTDYSVSKLALNAYSRLIAKRQQGHGLSVNCYCPGFTRTDMTRGQGSHTAAEAAEVGARLVLLPPDELPTGMFFKWSTKTCLASKL